VHALQSNVSDYWRYDELDAYKNEAIACVHITIIATWCRPINFSKGVQLE